MTRKLQTTLQETLRDPEVIKTIGENYVPKEFVGPEPFAKTISDLQQTYSQVFKR
ncbi:hypothetical protein [Actinomadura madurae]|uniref:hypothetical protein n=1 Tax=Actinomadura madurae TaxID=1993 RepID=UPI0020D1FCD2|nr:hypothetical protein [Actinomadura madurae]MCP9982780.1 hypothetical protein [Actinomadura madurae]MCQ0005670.1 hypothetical protein [Actinomadura madurae]